MIILDIHAAQSPTLPDILSQGLDERFGILCQRVDASPMSAFTALTIAGILKKQTVSAIVCRRRKDLLGALDASKLIKSETSKPTVVFAPQTESELAEKLTKSTLKAVDAIVVPTPQDMNRYLTVKEKITVIEPTYNIDNKIDYNRGNHHPLTISWIGPIVEHQRLDNLIKTTPKDININVYGTGEARYIMPIVKAARYIPDLHITWFGDEYSLSDAISATDIAVKTTRIPDPIQTQLYALGIPVIDTADIAILNTLYAERQQNNEVLDQMSEQSLIHYKTHLEPRFHVEQWYNLLCALRN